MTDIPPPSDAPDPTARPTSESPPPPPPPSAAPAVRPASPMAYDARGGRVPESVGGIVYQKPWNILLTIVTCGIWSYYWVYRTHEDLKLYKGDGLGGVIGLLLAIFVNPVVWFTIPYEIDEMYKREGRAAGVSVWWGLWFLLPIVGNFVWYLRMQDVLNDFWLGKGARAV